MRIDIPKRIVDLIFQKMETGYVALTLFNELEDLLLDIISETDEEFNQTREYLDQEMKQMFIQNSLKVN